MVDKLWTRCTSTQLADSLVHCAPNDLECNVQQLQSDLCVAAAKDQPQHRPLLPKLDILAVDPNEELQEEWEAEDDVKGGPLDTHECKYAREKKIKYLWDMEVYECSTEAEARARTGRKPVGLKWIDFNKGSAEAPRYRSRLVCTCQEDVFKVEDPFLITNADVSRAHFYADAVRDVYVRLPDEDPEAKQPSVFGKLRKTMYGSLGAAQRWGEHYAQVLEAGGFSRGVASPCHFFQKGLQTYILVHGDDFFIVGRREGRKHVLSLLRGACELSKVVTLGLGSSQSRTVVRFLDRTLTLRHWGIEYEPDRQHVSRALKALGLTNALCVATPGIDDAGGPKASEISELRRTAKWRDPPEEIEEDDLLTGEELKLFQSVAAKFNFLAVDRPDLLYSMKELMRKVASPRAEGISLRVTQNGKWRDPPEEIEEEAPSSCSREFNFLAMDRRPLHSQIFTNDGQISVDSTGQ